MLCLCKMEKSYPKVVKLHHRAKDLTNMKFGRLTVVQPTKNKNGYLMWHCHCECGKFTSVTTTDLKQGKTKSCGCYRDDKLRKLSTKGPNKYAIVGETTGIVLTNCDGYVRGLAIIDTENLDLVKSYRWSVKDKNCYISFGNIYLSRLLMQKELEGKKHLFVDHIDHNPWNNRKENLRICTHTQNTRNSKLRKDNTSGYKGVSYRKDNKCYRSYIQIDGKRSYLGEFDNPIKAAQVYNKAAIMHYGEFANLNDVPGLVD